MIDLVLAAAGGVCGGFALGWVLGHRRRKTAVAPAQPAYVCACGQEFYAEQPAKEHAVGTHNAHPEEWRPIMEGS